MKRTFLTKLSIIVLLGFTIAACNSDKKTETNSDSLTNETTTAADSTAKVEGVLVGGSMMVPTKNIVENALGSTDHTTLVALVKAGGLVETLSSAGPFTVFAPTNEAFTKLPAGTADKLLMPENKADLVKVLTYHVVAGAIKASDLTDGMELTTVEGSKLKVSVKNGVTKINDATVTIADIISSNGVTHVIDNVLLPAAKK